MDDITVQVVDSLDGWSISRSEWNGLLRNSRTNSIFLSWEWIRTWCEHFLKGDRRLYLLLLHEKGEIIGIAPWYIRNLRKGRFGVRRIEFLGAPETASDYLDVIVRKGKEDLVARRLFDHLVRESPSVWDIFWFRDVPANSLFFMHFLNEFKRAGKHIEAGEGAYCPVLTLPDTPEEFFDSLSSNRRQQFKRHLRILQEETAFRHTTLVGEQAGQAITVVQSIYKLRWGREERELFDFLRDFAATGEGRNLFQVDLITLHGDHAGGIIHFNHEGIRSMYIMVVDRNLFPKLSVGNALIGLCIMEAIREKYGKYDFLKGEEAYKFHWANHAERSIHIRGFNRNLRSALFFLGESARRMGKVIVR